MKTNFSSDELKELIGYLGKMDSYEDDLEVRYNLTSGYIWGLLLVLTGIYDYFFVLYVNNAYLPWLFMYMIGILITNRFKKDLRFARMKMNKDVKKRSPVEEIYLAVSFIFISAVISFLVFSDNWRFSFAFVGTFILVQDLVMSRGEQWEHKRLSYLLEDDIASSNLSLRLSWIMRIFQVCVLISVVVNLGSAIFFGNTFALYQGVIFGVLSGSGVLIQFWLTERLLFPND